MTQETSSASDFIRNLDLPPPPHRWRGDSPTKTEGYLDQSRGGAALVGSDIVSFGAGVQSELREAIVHCTLLAQLAANRRVPARDDIRQWYAVYFDTLVRLGWLSHSREFSGHLAAGAEVEVHEAMLEVAKVLLGSAPTSLALVESTLASMKAMSRGSWITIFNRESQSVRTARFQLTVAEAATPDYVTIHQMAFELVAQSTLTQVLFFKQRSKDITLHHASGRIGVHSSVLEGLRPTLSQRVADYTSDFVKALEI